MYIKDYPYEEMEYEGDPKISHPLGQAWGQMIYFDLLIMFIY
jgi:hypothetical protein